MAESIAGINSGSIQANYMKLLVVQLQNQNPLEPLSNSEMAAQLAQLTQLGQIEELNTKFSGVLTAVERNYASSLTGKEVSFLAENESGDVELTSGLVEEVVVGGNNEISLKVGEYAVGLSQVLSVK